MPDPELRCPACGAPVPAGAERPAAFPFCSSRCRLRDLGAWFDGRYRVGGRDLEPEDLEEQAR
jgi:endogenous inhibitor of DNA gyrase (YacG/DUF329 family)